MYTLPAAILLSLLHASHTIAQAISGIYITVDSGNSTLDNIPAGAYHVGAAQSYIVVPSSPANPPFNNFTLSYRPDLASGAELSAVLGPYGFTCGVSFDQLWANQAAAPLQCGALNWNSSIADFNATFNGGNSGDLGIQGIESWWLCDAAAASSPAPIPMTIVGSTTGLAPNNTALLVNCMGLEGLSWALNLPSASTTSTAPAPTPYTNATVVPPAPYANVTTGTSSATTKPSVSAPGITSSTPPQYTGGAATAVMVAGAIKAAAAGAAALLFV